MNNIYHTGTEPISRIQFFNAYWDDIDAAGWDAVILHSWRDFPEYIPSDVDYAVSNCQLKDLISHLISFCIKHNWLLVQVIEHEPDAFYCVCIQNGGDYQTIALDATIDYRRLGHLLISSSMMHKDSRKAPNKKFSVPSPGMESAYLLAKAAAKGKPFQEVSNRLHELLVEDQSDCIQKLHEVYGIDIKHTSSPRECVKCLQRWFPDAEAFLKIRSGRRLGIREILLYMRRIIHPTGIRMVISGDWCSDENIEHAIAPVKSLFRQHHITKNSGLSTWLERIIAMIRTSLVVQHSRESRHTNSNHSCLIISSSETTNSEITEQLIQHLAKRVYRRYSYGSFRSASTNYEPAP